MRMEFRMVEMQLMNIVNIGVSKNISVSDIEILADSTINATQLFLSDGEIKILRTQLNKRLEKQKLMI